MMAMLASAANMQSYREWSWTLWSVDQESNATLAIKTYIATSKMNLVKQLHLMMIEPGTMGSSCITLSCLPD